MLELIKGLSDILQTDRVDVSDLTHADPLFLYSVTQKSILLAGKRSDYQELLRLAFHKYNDYLPFLEKEKKYVIEKIKNFLKKLPNQRA